MSAFLSEPSWERRGSLGDVLLILEATGLRLVSSPLGRDLAVSRTVLFEPRERLQRTPAGMLLGVGLSLSGGMGLQAVAAAAKNGFSAMVVKAYGEDPAPLADLADSQGLALLVVHDDVEWLSLHSHVNNALVTATQQADSISSVAVGDLFSLAEAVADTVGGATAIEDYSQQILAYSSRGNHLIDDERREGILGRQVPDLPENAEQYRRLYSAESTCRYPATEHGHARLAVAVRAGAEVLGSIWVIDDGNGLATHAESALQGAASVAALHLLRARRSDDLARQQRSEAARRLLNTASDPAGAAAALGLEASGPFAVLVLAPMELDDAWLAVAERLLPMVALHAETRLGRTGVVLADGSVQVVAAGPRVVRTETLTAVGKAVVAAANRSLGLQLLIGISRVVHHPARVGGARDEAFRVVTLLRRRPMLGTVATVDQVSDQLCLAALGELLGRDDQLVPARARAVLDHDAHHGTMYANLLLAHLNNGREVSRSADALGVHPNTVRYRLRRAVELFGLDLADGDQVLPLWLALTHLARPV